MNAYEESRANLVQDLINTYDLYLDEPERLREVANLHYFLKSHDISVENTLTQTTLEQVRLLRGQLRACWTADSLDEMIKLLNPLLAQVDVTLQVNANEQNHIYLQFTPQQEASLIQRLAIDCAMGIVFVLQHYGIERMRACDAEPCRDVFIDISRNKTRRFCSERCANRYNIAAFRDRQKHDQSSKN